MILRIRPATSLERKQEILEAWYREQLKAMLPQLLAKWEPLMGVKVGRCFVQKMKTKWGSCSHPAGNIRLNTDLAKKPPECLEYIVVHELAHILEPTHNQHFIALMDQFMPKWKFYKAQLNRLPVRHEDWGY
jgi:predicted metal-dependent hydrolase